MADPMTDLEIRDEIRAKNDPIERILLQIYHELRGLTLQTYALDHRRMEEKDRVLLDHDSHAHHREDDEHWPFGT
jgi:hypothetical protein